MDCWITHSRNATPESACPWTIHILVGSNVHNGMNGINTYIQARAVTRDQSIRSHNRFLNSNARISLQSNFRAGNKRNLHVILNFLV